MIHIYAVSESVGFSDIFKPKFHYVVSDLEPEEFKAWLMADAANEGCTITNIPLDVDEYEPAEEAILGINDLSARAGRRILERLLEAVGLFGQQNPHH